MKKHIIENFKTLENYAALMGVDLILENNYDCNMVGLRFDPVDYSHITLAIMQASESKITNTLIIVNHNELD